ncbi:S41 family peptidase [Deinococcus maricopensis]|uniref:Peptidase S41 n=1 Tax=Deinococcus maricopensis (strain DSM 21211 / LMG 22137 / NRRL B-23946 / LB-34) TaxID=709986 RepID=E8UA49_DEIML|nr:S41 family peptidase [Deinococcus maricopensis]ADV67938.1 peptidase S41 [Deinococcus maricopensis DSM 21211]
MLRRALTFALALTGGALASPATDLFRATTTPLLNDYYGWSAADRAALTAQYAAKLAEACVPAADTCSFDTARAVLKDLLAELHDAHTNLRDPEGAERLREIQRDLTVPRTGARVSKTPLGLLVTGVTPGSPADTAGLQRFDLLTAVNGQSAGSGDGQVDGNAFIRLERASAPLTVTVARAGQGPRDLTLTPAPLKARDVPTTTWRGRTAVIQLPSFLNADAARLFLAELDRAKWSGANALVIDLRYNGGGRLDQCIAAASAFAPALYDARTPYGAAQYAAVNGKSVPPLSARHAQPYERRWTGKTSVLVGENTASCAEVFAYTLQRAGAARVIGAPTKGVLNSAVNFIDLPDAGVLSLTTVRAYDAKGQPFPDHVTPDVTVDADLTVLTRDGRDVVLDAALNDLDVSGN